MSDPQAALQAAIYQELTTPPLLLSGATFPVYSHAPAGALQYVRLEAFTTSQRPAPAGCRAWDCAFQLSIITHFPAANQVSEKPAYELSEQILARLQDQRLTLAAGELQSLPVRLALARTVQEKDQEAVYVLRQLRLQSQLYTAR